MSTSGYRAERGVAAELGADEPRLWRYPEIWRVIGVVSGGTGHRDTSFGLGDVEASIGYDVGRSEIESYATRAYDEVTGTENGDDRTLTVRLLADHTLGATGDLQLAFTYAAVSHDSEVDGALSEYEQRLWSLGGETIWRLVDGSPGSLNSLAFSVGGAIDGGSTPETGGLEPLDALTDWGARAGATAAFGNGSLLVHAGVSRRGRFPALREMYSEALNRFEPNPDLVPEHLLAFEAGATTRVAGGELQVVGFHHRLSDAIRRISLPNGRRQRVNAEQIRSAGAELLGSQRFGPLSLGFDLTLQAVDLVDDATSESREPENLPGVFGGVNARFPIALGFDGMAEARYTGSQFCLDLNTGADRRLDAGTWINAGLSRVFSIGSPAAGPFTRLQARVAADNIADTAIYDQCGLPQPGRLMRLEFRLF
jgi:iron complex outermembrane receptor protein